MEVRQQPPRHANPPRHGSSNSRGRRRPRSHPEPPSRVPCRFFNSPSGYYLPYRFPPLSGLMIQLTRGRCVDATEARTVSSCTRIQPPTPLLPLPCPLARSSSRPVLLLPLARQARHSPMQIHLQPTTPTPLFTLVASAMTSRRCLDCSLNVAMYSASVLWLSPTAL